MDRRRFLASIAAAVIAPEMAKSAKTEGAISDCVIYDRRLTQQEMTVVFHFPDPVPAAGRWKTGP
jgi:hypothetical protein